MEQAFLLFIFSGGEMMNSTYKLHLLLEAIAVGIGAGIIVSIFRYALEMANFLRLNVRDFLALCYLQNDFLTLMLAAMGILILLAIIACVLAKLNRYEPMAAGGGIPQVKGVLMGEMKMRPWRVLIVKLVGATLGLSAGLSLGRQGPSVQFGACIGMGLGEKLNRPIAETHALMNAGAGAALAAAFNAPLAGVMFALEELAHNFSGMLLLVSFTAAVNAAVVSEIVFGASPIFAIGELPLMPLGSGCLLWTSLGIFSGFLGLLFNLMLPHMQSLYAHLIRRGVPYGLCIFGVLAIAFILLFFCPAVIGGGDFLVNYVLSSNLPLKILIILLLAKFIFTGLCFGTGAPGGLFLPMMSLGALSGGIFAEILGAAGLLPLEFITSCIVFGMAGYFTAVTKAPVSSVILIVELTESLDHLLPLLIVTLTAFFVSDMLGGKPIYERLLAGGLKRAHKI